MTANLAHTAMLNLDGQLFDLLNALAGRAGWFDAGCAWLALFGAPVLVVLALWPAWWTSRPAATRRGYALTLLFAGAICIACYTLELLVTTHVLGHGLRSRPANGRWATTLLTMDSAMSFPAWPMVIAGLLLPPVLRVARRLGMALAGLSGLVGASLVCAGINYPLDVLVGTVLGIGIGWAGMTLARLPSPTPALGARRWVGVGSMAVVLLVTGSATTVLIVRGGEHRPPATPGIVAPRISPPNQASAALSSAVAPHTARLEAASDGHMCVAVAYVALPEHASLANVQTTARSAVNATFAAWPQLDLLTVAVQYAVAGRSGTLYTATVERASVPPGGFPPDRALPGAKFFHQRLLSGR